MTDSHQSQYDPGCSPITRQSGCTWTSGASGVWTVTGQRYKPTPDEIHALVRRDEETAPTTPGWSLTDLRLAMGRYGMTFIDRTGTGWEGVKAERALERYVVLQGDSDQFPAGCSGTFEGLHCIGIHPKTKAERGVVWWWVNDPICPAGRWERETILRRYASKLWTTIRFGSFTQPVPQSWRVAIPRAETIYLFTVTNGVITGARKTVTGEAVNRACSKPHTYRWPGHLARSLVQLDNNGAYVNSKYAYEVNP